MSRKRPYISGLVGYANTVCSRFKEHFISVIKSVDLDKAVEEYLSTREDLREIEHAVRYVIEETTSSIRRAVCEKIVSESRGLPIDKLIRYTTLVGLEECEELVNVLENRLKLEASNLSLHVLHEALANRSIMANEKLAEILVNEYKSRILNASCEYLPVVLLAGSAITIYSHSYIETRLVKVLTAVASRVECSDTVIALLEKAVVRGQPRPRVLAKALIEMAKSAAEKMSSLDCNGILLVASWLAKTARKYRSRLSRIVEWSDLKNSLEQYMSRLSLVKDRCGVNAVENAISELRQILEGTW